MKPLFVGALLVGLYQFTHPAGFGFGNGFEMATVAKSLAEHGTFADPFAPLASTGPTAVIPPLYPLYLAVLIKLLKAPTLIVSAACIANVLVNAVIAALMPRLSTVVYGRPEPGIAAGVLWILCMRLMPQFDASFTVAGLILFCLFTASRRSDLRTAAAAGAIGGMLTLANPATVFVFLPWTVYLKPGRRYVGVLVLMVGLCNLPWLVRNYLVFHAPVLRTNFGMTFYSSNNDCASASLMADGRNGCYQLTHPVASAAEIKLLSDLGEVEYDRQRTAATFRWIRGHFDRFSQLTGARVIEFWFPDPSGVGAPAWFIWAATALSLPGFILMWRRREPFASFLLSVWLIYPLMYYVVVSSDRYRYPLLWTSLLPAGYLLFTLKAAYTRRVTPDTASGAAPTARPLVSQ